jgi:hypothetical protein
MNEINWKSLSTELASQHAAFTNIPSIHVVFFFSPDSFSSVTFLHMLHPAFPASAIGVNAEKVGIETVSQHH